MPSYLSVTAFHLRTISGDLRFREPTSPSSQFIVTTRACRHPVDTAAWYTSVICTSTQQHLIHFQVSCLIFYSSQGSELLSPTVISRRTILHYCLNHLFNNLISTTQTRSPTSLGAQLLSGLLVDHLLCTHVHYNLPSTDAFTIPPVAIQI